MKKFRFTLKSVQTVRHIRELRAREVFGEAVRAEAAAQAALTAARDELAELERVVAAKRSGTFLPAEQISFLYEFQVQRERVKRATEGLTLAQRTLAKAREGWIAARKDVRMIDNLESKARMEHRLESDREEQALLDDRTNATAGRVQLLTS